MICIIFCVAINKLNAVIGEESGINSWTRAGLLYC